MTDYVWSIGTGDEMMIRDTGTNVEFWFHSDTSTFNHEQGFSYTINGHTVSSTFDLPSDGAWHRLGYENVTTDQTVSFTMNGAGLGWNTTTHTAAIDRASAPSPPKAPVLTVRSSTVIELDWGGDGANNGAGVDLRQYSGSSAQAVGTIVTETANYQWGGLTPGKKYYFYARAHNAKGYSGWSPVASATTWNVPAAPSVPNVNSITDTTFWTWITDGANNGQTIDQRQVGYSTTPTGSITWVAIAASGGAITGLTPGTGYYLWARTHNSVGWSPLSAQGFVTTMRPPDAPTTPSLSEVKSTSLRAIFSENGDGGSPITGYQLGYSTSPSAPETYVTSDKDDTLENLNPGTTYYVWGRASNAYGWGPVSATPASVRTAAGAKVYSGVTPKDAVPWVNVQGVWKHAKPWVKIAGVWKETK